MSGRATIRQNRVVIMHGATEFAAVMTAWVPTMTLIIFMVVSSDALPQSKTNLSASAGKIPWNARGTTMQSSARKVPTFRE